MDIEKLQKKVKSTMNGIFKRLKLRIKVDVSSTIINQRLYICVKIPEDKFVLMEMLDIHKDYISGEFYNNFLKSLKSYCNEPRINGVNIEYKIKKS